MPYSKNAHKVYVKFQAEGWNEDEFILSKEYNNRNEHEYYVIPPSGAASTMTHLEHNLMVKTLNLKIVDYLTEQDVMNMGKISAKSVDLSDLA